MDKYLINGGRKLSGKVTVSSAKNTVLPMLATSILTDEEIVIKNCPQITDVYAMVNVLTNLGVKSLWYENDLILKGNSLSAYSVPNKLSCELRTSILVLGALLSRLGKGLIAYPGGCNLGERPIDIHITGLKKLGAKIIESEKGLVCSCKKLVGTEMSLPFPSVGATENILLASVLAKGQTVIHNVAKEPEIVDLANFLNKMGAKISGAGTHTIFVDGVERLSGVEYFPISDRIEAGTFIIATAVTGGEVQVSNIKSENISSLISKLCDNTCKISIKNDIIYVKCGKRRKAFDVITGPYPMFPTDLQAQITVLACVSNGTSVIQENVFENRFCHVKELQSMGADIYVNGRTAIVNGVSKLHGANVSSHDLRCGASLVIAGLGAEGKTLVKDIKHLDRGYSNLEQKLCELGADIKRLR